MIIYLVEAAPTSYPQGMPPEVGCGSPTNKTN